jgi:EPS-associated MarR family transcriptional regulator
LIGNLFGLPISRSNIVEPLLAADPRPITTETNKRMLNLHRNQLQEDMHFRLMRLLEQNPQVSQREIAEQLGMSLGSINYCIKALIEKGYIKVSNFNKNPNKLSYAYLLTSNGIVAKASLTGNFLKRKIAEYEALKSEIETLQGAQPQAGIQTPQQEG